jgi:hypothetical protein
MKVRSSLKFRTAGREEIRVKRNRKSMILPTKDSVKGGRLKVRSRIPRSRRKLIRKKMKY